MRESERLKLKELLDMGKPKEEILEAMKPNRRKDGHSTPKGGISLRAAARKYGIPYTTLWRRVKAGIKSGEIRILAETKNWLYVEETGLKTFLENQKNQA